MEQITISANDLRSLMVSSARLGYAKGGQIAGERKLEDVIIGISVTVDGLKKTNKAK